MQNLEGERKPNTRPTPFSMRLKLMGALVKEWILHPLVTSRFGLDVENNRIIVERGKFDEPTPSPKMQLKAVRVLLIETILHPLITSTIVYDMEQGKVYAVRENKPKPR